MFTRDDPDRILRGGDFAGGVQKRATMKILRSKPVAQHIEHAEQVFARSLALLQRARDKPVHPAFVAPFQRSGNERVFRFEMRVEAFARGAGLFDDRIDACGMDAAGVDQCFRSIEQPFTRAAGRSRFSWVLNSHVRRVERSFSFVKFLCTSAG